MESCLPRWCPVSMRKARHWTAINVSLIAGADATGQCYKALGFSPGFAPDADASPYLKLLPMLAGIGSPGTIQEVSFTSPHNTSVLSLPLLCIKPGLWQITNYASAAAAWKEPLTWACRC